MKLNDLKWHPSALHFLKTEITAGSNSNDSLIFGIDENAQKYITPNKTRLTVAIAYLIISEDVLFNFPQKKFKKELDLAINVSRTYIIPNR